MTDQPSFYAIIPADVRYDKNLCASAKMLYGEITALTQKDGYCWASNKYFADLYNVSESTVKRWLSNLKEQNYIEIDSKKVGLKWDRKIYLKNIIRRVENDPSKAQKRADRRLKNEPILIQDTNTTLDYTLTGVKGQGPCERDDSCSSQVDDCSDKSCKRESKIRRAEHVATTQREHERLVSEFGEERVQKAYLVLSVWKKDTPRSKWKKCDNRSLRRWALDAAQDANDDGVVPRHTYCSNRPSAAKYERLRKKSNSNPCLSPEESAQYDDLW